MNTPGPWTVVDHGHTHQQLTTPPTPGYGVLVRTPAGNWWGTRLKDHEGLLADARLISAAPDLLGVLVGLDEDGWLDCEYHGKSLSHGPDAPEVQSGEFSGDWCQCDRYARIRAAIDKARGEA